CLELVLEHGRAPHPVEPEAALVVAGAIPGVDVPVRQPPLDRVRLDDVQRRLPVFLFQVFGLTSRRRRIAFVRIATSPSAALSELGSGVCVSSNSPNVSSSFLRTRSSGRCASAAISGPTNSSAS